MPIPTLIEPAARLASGGDQKARVDHAARRREPCLAGPAREQETNRLVEGNVDVAVGPGRAPNLEHAREVSLHVLLDVDREDELWRTSELALALGDDGADDRRVRVVEPLGERRVDAPARGGRAREHERGERYQEQSLQTSISSASP